MISDAFSKELPKKLSKKILRKLKTNTAGTHEENYKEIRTNITNIAKGIPKAFA